MEEPEIYDGAWKLMLYDAETQRSVWMTAQDDKFIFRVDMPLGEIFDANHEAEAATMGNRFGDYARLASVPLDMLAPTGLDSAMRQKDDQWVSKWLNNSDHRKFRTSRGTA